MIPRALAAWGDLRGSIRAELAEKPSEPTVFAWLMIALALVGLASIPAEMLAPLPEGAERMPGLGFAVSVTLAPLVWYALAAIAGLIIRSLGGARSYGEHRAIWFWQALVTMPVSVAAELLRLPLETAAGPAAGLALSLAAGAASLLVFWRFYAAAEDWPAMLANRHRRTLAYLYAGLLALLLVWGVATRLATLFGGA